MLLGFTSMNFIDEGCKKIDETFKNLSFFSCIQYPIHVTGFYNKFVFNFILLTWSLNFKIMGIPCFP